MSPACSPLILATERGRAWGEDHFRHLFAELRKLAELPRDFQYRDLRRSAVIRLARAGCTIPEIVSITGHSLKTVHTILSTYMPPDSTVARNAIRKLDRAARRRLAPA